MVDWQWRTLEKGKKDLEGRKLVHFLTGRVGHVFKRSKQSCPTQGGGEGKDFSMVENREPLSFTW